MGVYPRAYHAPFDVDVEIEAVIGTETPREKVA
jgi:hypothetical protein